MAAETAEQCQATLNSYRAKAGLAKASSTSIPALGVAAGRHAGYRVNVDPGDSIVLSQLGLPDLGLFGPDATAHLETPSLVRLGFTGVNPWDRTRAAKLADGTWRYQYEDVTTATGIPVAQLQGVRSWVDAPYHRLPLMDANTRHIGCSASQRVVNGRTYSAEVLEMATTWKDTTKRITVYPANGQTGVPTTFNRCQEHPTPLRRPLRHGPPGPERRLRRHPPGRRLLRHEDPGHRLLPRLVRQPGRHPPGRPLPHRQVDRGRLVGGREPPHQRGHARRHRPLAANTRYNVPVSGYVQATKGAKWVQFKTHTWSFTTA